jgi:hypothetical protein
MKTLQPALQAWREADLRLQEAGPSATPEMAQELAAAKRRYQELAAELTAQRWDQATAVPPDPYHDAAPGAPEGVHLERAGRGAAAAD